MALIFKLIDVVFKVSDQYFSGVSNWTDFIRCLTPSPLLNDSKLSIRIHVSSMGKAL